MWRLRARIVIKILSAFSSLGVLMVGVLVMPGVYGGEGFEIKVLWFCLVGYLIVDLLERLMLWIIGD